MIAHLDDAQVRDLLLFYLGKTAPAPAAAASPDRVLESVEKSGQVIRRNIVATVASVRDVPAAVGTAFGNVPGIGDTPLRRHRARGRADELQRPLLEDRE